MPDRTTSPLAVVAVGNSGMQIIDRQGDQNPALILGLAIAGTPVACDCADRYL